VISVTRFARTIQYPGDPDQIVAAVVVRDDRVLLCHRSADHRWYPDVWDLAGGHVDAGETPASALVRELREELGVVIEEPVEPELARIVTDGFDLRIWLVRQWTGEPTNTAPDEHDDVAWFGTAELAGLHLADESFRSLITEVLTRQARR